MHDDEALNDIHFLRDVVAKTQPAVNHFWPVSVGWGCVVTFGYLLSAFLGLKGRVDILPWVWPALIVLVGLPLHLYLVRRVKSGLEQTGVRARFRKDLMLCWMSISVIGLLWSTGMAASGEIAPTGTFWCLSGVRSTWWVM